MREASSGLSISSLRSHVRRIPCRGVALSDGAASAKAASHFRVLKMAQHVGEAGVLLNALKASRAKIFVFFFSVMTLVLIEGTIMYLIEGEINPGFRNIPQSIYWAIVTLPRWATAT